MNGQVFMSAFIVFCVCWFLHHAFQMPSAPIIAKRVKGMNALLAIGSFVLMIICGFVRIWTI